VGGELRAVGLAEGGELGAGLFERDAGTEAGDRLGVAGAVLDLLRREAADFEHARREHLGVGPGVGQPRRHDAHHLPGEAVEGDGAAEEVGPPAELGLPQFVADDDDGGPVGHVLLRREVAALRRRHADGGEERRADAQALELLGVAVAGEGEVVEGAEADGGE
jgi:hypothetical protein